MTLSLVIVSAIAMPGLVGSFQAVLEADPGQPGAEIPLALWIVLPAIAIFYLIGLMVYGYLQGAVTHLVWNHTRLGDSRFRSTLNPWHLVWHYLSNVVCIVLSLGFLTPWAQIRMARYRIEQLTLLARRDLGTYAAGARQEAHATGEEASDLFDVGIAV